MKNQQKKGRASARYSPEVAAFITAHVAGRSVRELAELASARFGCTFSPESVANFKKRNKLTSGLPPGGAHGRRVFTPAMESAIQAAGADVSNAALARELNKQFYAAVTARQIRAYRWRSGLQQPAARPQAARVNGRFAKGCTPENYLPEGSVVCKSDGYLYRKMGRNTWRQEHLLVWEAANGPVPRGCVLIFKDGNRENTSLENLECIFKGEHLQMVKRGLRFSDAAWTETGILIARLQRIARKRKKE